jgi:hypothetical protein
MTASLEKPSSPSGFLINSVWWIIFPRTTNKESEANMTFKYPAKFLEAHLHCFHPFNVAFLNIYTSLSYFKLLSLKWKYKSKLFLKKTHTSKLVPLVIELENWGGGKY